MNYLPAIAASNAERSEVMNVESIAFGKAPNLPLPEPVSI